MAISGDYSSPVTVNGYSCRNCTDVARAEKNVDPANPSAGPFGVNADKNDPKAEKNHFSPQARQQDELEKAHRKQTELAATTVAAAYSAAGAGATPGHFVNLSA